MIWTASPMAEEPLRASTVSDVLAAGIPNQFSHRHPGLKLGEVLNVVSSWKSSGCGSVWRAWSHVVSPVEILAGESSANVCKLRS